MTKFSIKLRYKKHIWSNYGNGSFNYNNCQVDYNFFDLNTKEIGMDISILTEASVTDISPVFIEIIDFIYLACGTMPIIDCYKINNNDIDLNQISCRFFPSKKHFTCDQLIDITNQTLNDQTLSNVNNIIRGKPFEIFSAFTALTSIAYEEIYLEHKIALLLHCFDGYIYNKGKCYQVKTFKDRIKIIVKNLFDYDAKYNAEVLKSLNYYSNDEYLQALTDTRNQFSHYIYKKNAFNNGEKYIVNFFLLHYIFRIYLIKEINLIPNEKNIEEFFKSMYDWINTLNNPNFNSFKSVAYTWNKFFRR